MRSKILYATFFIILVITSVSCKKEEDWVKTEGVNPAESVSVQLNSIISEDNDCLTMIEDKSQLHVIFSSSNFEEIDSCHQLSEINFNNQTLIVGKVQVYSNADDVASINLSSKNNKYKVEVIIDKCSECPSAIRYIYFWKLYPKLEPGYIYELIVN